MENNLRKCSRCAEEIHFTLFFEEEQLCLDCKIKKDLENKK